MRYHDRAVYLCVLRELSALKVKKKKNYFNTTGKEQTRKK